MNNNFNSDGARFSLYFPPNCEELFHYVSQQVDEKGKKINRNKFILKVLEEHYQNQVNITKSTQHVNDVSNQELLNELQILKKMISEMKVIESNNFENNSSNEESETKNSISLTKEELQQLNNPMF